MHRALPSFAWVFLMLPGCGDTPPTEEPLGGGQGGSGGVVDPSDSGDAGGTEEPEDPSSGGGADDASLGFQDTDGGDDGSTGDAEVVGVCGDGFLDDDEFCDDGNVSSGDGCDSDCTETIGVMAFATGGAHTCAVSFEGTVRCFGDNTWGQLGIGSKETIGDDETPLEANHLVEVPRIRQLSAGLRHTCAVSDDHDVYCWGANGSGQLGLGHTETWGNGEREAPVAVELGGPVASVTAGANHTCALMFGGAVRCWGSGETGQLGHGDGFDGTVGAGEKPYAQVMDAPPVDLGRNPLVRWISAGYDHTCAVNAMGEAHCWGDGTGGRLGTGEEKPVGLSQPPSSHGQVTIDIAVRGVFASSRHSCVVTDDARLQCFGNNDDGQLGLGHRKAIGDNERINDFRLDLDGEKVRAAALTEDSTCALTDHATVLCWGAGDNGQLANGSKDTVGDDELPVEWDGFGPVKLSRPATAIDAGSKHVCARTDDARLRCWGNADDGRLGQGIEDLGPHGNHPTEREPLVVRIFR